MSIVASSIVASPTQQGVVKKPNAAHLRTNILNGKVKVASSTNSTGGQSAVYSIEGGSITNNVKVVLPNLTADDTIATQGDNINWTGNHTFQQGLNSIGPITTASSISAGSVSSTNITSTGNLSAIGGVSANGDLTLLGQINPSGLTTTTGGDMTVGQSLTVNSDHTVTGTSNLNGPAIARTNMTFSVSGTDASVFNITTGSTNGTMIGASSSQKVGFQGTTPTVKGSSHGALIATATYGGNEQTMLNDAYAVLRFKGLMV